VLYFDGSIQPKCVNIRFLLVYQTDELIYYACHLNFFARNNMAEYEALIMCLENIISLGFGSY
jgi:ribonuclease HI